MVQLNDVQVECFLLVECQNVSSSSSSLYLIVDDCFRVSFILKRILGSLFLVGLKLDIRISRSEMWSIVRCFRLAFVFGSFFWVLSFFCGMVSRLSSEEENPKLIFESQDYRNRTCLLIIERFPFVLLDILSFRSLKISRRLRNFSNFTHFKVPSKLIYLEYNLGREWSLNDKNTAPSPSRTINFSTFLLPFRISRKISLSPMRILSIYIEERVSFF